MTGWTPGMAGQVALPYPFYIDIVTKRYFDGVDNKNLTQVLNCFAPDAILHEATSDTAISSIRLTRKQMRSVRSSPC